MQTIRHFHLVLLGVLWAAVFGLVGYNVGTASRPEVILRNPEPNDLVVINGCVVSACQYLASVRARHELEPQFWSRVMLVRYKNSSAGHAYCVWETDGHIFGYDRNNGGFPIPTQTRDPVAIASALAGELGRVLNRPMEVEKAEFIEPAESRVYAL
ncbi:MAG: hypothetical protein ABI680_06205 [Chthoniobacteraceae bacterium]